MSNAAITWALKQRIRPSSLKFVLVVFADVANHEMLCWPGVHYVAESTCQDRKTVIDQIKKLTQLGFLVDSGQRRGKTGKIICYRLNIPITGSVSDESNNAPKSPENGTLKECKKAGVRVPFVPLKESRFEDSHLYGTLKEPYNHGEDMNLFEKKLVSVGMDLIKIRRWLPKNDINLDSKSVQIIRCATKFCADYVDQQFSMYLTDAFSNWRIEYPEKKKTPARKETANA